MKCSETMHQNQTKNSYGVIPLLYHQGSQLLDKTRYCRVYSRPREWNGGLTVGDSEGKSEAVTWG